MSLRSIFTRASDVVRREWNRGLETKHLLMGVNVVNATLAVINGIAGSNRPDTIYEPIAMLNACCAVTGGLGSLLLWLQDRDQRRRNESYARSVANAAIARAMGRLYDPYD